MLEIKIMPRGSGKTTKVIELMNNDGDLFLIIPLLATKGFYPDNLHDRIGSHRNFIDGALRGKRIGKVVLDEGFSGDKESLAKLYYWLGHKRIDVVSYGTL